ncbi:MAG: HAD hydrolase family protein [Bacteroidetes bacterium]|nr:HAD hydrolase family protein [Bacteroidota bacterium]
MANFKEKLNKIKAFAFDFDGVLTNGTITLMPDGEHIRTVNAKDGYAMHQAVSKGYKITLITRASSEHIKLHLKEVGITDIYLKSFDKLESLTDFVFSNHIDFEEVLYMGDDVPDMECMQKCGASTCPADAVHEVRAICDYTSPFKGGEGCVRDVIEQVLRLHNKWVN